VSDLDQRRRTVRVLELIGQFTQADARGGTAEADRLISEAADVDPLAVAWIHDSIVAREIPNPERDWPAWTEYVQAARDALAEAEQDGEA
jgi:hypothetical protein